MHLLSHVVDTSVTGHRSDESAPLRWVLRRLVELFLPLVISRIPQASSLDHFQCPHTVPCSTLLCFYPEQEFTTLNRAQACVFALCGSCARRHIT
jgi:hypothetical protein